MRSFPWKYIFYLPVLIFLFPRDNLICQPSYSRSVYTTADGLAYNTVHSICQDKTGFLWIATWDGLSRFDGYEFKNYYSNPDDSLTIPQFSIDKVVCDNHNNLYALCFDRPVAKYNRATDKFEILNIFYQGKILECTDIQIDNNDDIWLSGRNGVFRSSDNGSTFRHILLYNPDGTTYSPLANPMMAIDNNSGIWLYYFVSGKITVIPTNRLSDSSLVVNINSGIESENFPGDEFHKNGMIRIFKSTEGKIWFFSDKGRYHSYPGSKRMNRVISDEGLNELSGSTPFLWIDNETGINIFDPVGRNLKNIPGSSGNAYSNFFISNDGLIWCGSENPDPERKGLTRFYATPSYFNYYLTEKNENGEPNLIFPILKDKNGDIWTQARRSDYLFHIKKDGKILREKFPDHYPGNSYPLARTMVEDETGIWFGCTGNNLIHYNFSDHSFKTCLNSPLIFKNLPTQLGIHNILKLNHEVLINGWLGLYLYNPEINRLRLVYRSSTDGSGFTMEKLKNGDIWIGSHTATIIHLDSNFIKKESVRFGIRKELVTDIIEGDANDLWITFQGSGLGHLHLPSNKYETYTTADGLANNTVYSVLRDKNGVLWLSTDKGISSFNPESRKFRNYSGNDGLLIEEFNDDSSFIDEDGNVYFGGVGGIVSFNPDKIKESERFNYPLIITSIKVSGRDIVSKKPVCELDSISLPKGTSNFLVTVACLNLRDGNNLKYRYRLPGIENEWIETDQKNRNLNLYNVKPGHYRLETEAVGNNGNWSSETSIVLYIPPRIIDTIWFRILMIFSVLLLISGVIIVYISQINMKSKQESDALKLEALRARMNPHFIFNSLNSINYFISKNDKLSANHYVSDFSRLMRSFLDNLSGEYSMLSTEIQMIKDYLELEKLRFPDKFVYKVSVEPGLSPGTCYILPGIIQPFVENSVWHGVMTLEDRIGNISVNLSSPDPYTVKCIISDDGIGRTIAAQYRNNYTGRKSRSMEIVKERLKLYNQNSKRKFNMSVEDLYADRLETGTIISIEIPAKIL